MQKNPFFDTQKLKFYGAKMLELIDRNWEKMERMPVRPKIEPGHLRRALPAEPPTKGEPLDDILKDTEDILIPSMTHWQHPSFFAFFPSGSSHPAIIGDMLANAFNTPGFTWAANPATTELDHIVSDWIVKMCSLPEKFLFSSTGGGCTITTMGEGLLLTLHVAKHRKMRELGITPTDPRILRLVAYYPETAHSAISKAILLKDVPYFREIPYIYDEAAKDFSMNVGKLEEMLSKDVSEGLIPFFIMGTIGSTPICGIDPLKEIGALAKAHNMWFTIDAAYAGGALVCPEFKEIGVGIGYCDSILINFAKWMMCTMNASFMFVADKIEFTELNGGDINPVYMNNRYTGQAEVFDQKDWVVGLGKRGNIYKIWYVIRNFGIEGLQTNIRHCVRLAEYFQKKLAESNSFEIVCKPRLSLTCFRLRNLNELTEEEMNKKTDDFVKYLSEDTTVGYVVPGKVAGKMFIRMVVCNSSTNESHIDRFVERLNEVAKELA